MPVQVLFQENCYVNCYSNRLLNQVKWYSLAQEKKTIKSIQNYSTQNWKVKKGWKMQKENKRNIQAWLITVYSISSTAVSLAASSFLRLASQASPVLDSKQQCSASGIYYEWVKVMEYISISTNRCDRMCLFRSGCRSPEELVLACWYGKFECPNLKKQKHKMIKW